MAYLVFDKGGFLLFKFTNIKQMRMLNSDGSCDLQNLEYKELQRICKLLKLPATGSQSALRNRLEDYEEQKNVTLKIFIFTIVRDSNPPNEKEYSYKVLEVETNE